MAALNRLTQRIKENFIESTRDIQLLTGGAGSSTPYFDTSDDKVKEISKLLESRTERDRLEGMKRIIAGMSKGRDMEGFFAQVVKNVVAGSIEIRKLVYIFLLRYAATNSDLLLLSINTFQKDLSDTSPLIRSMSLRVLTSIRVPVIQGIVMLGLKKLVNDRNPWVRKTVAGGLAKVYDMDSSSLPQLIALIQTLLASSSPLTLGATLTAFMEICPDRLDLLHPYYHHIVRLLVDADEWGQIVALQVLTFYARTMLEKPDTAGNIDPSSITKPQPKVNDEESEDEFDGIDTDLAMFLHLAKPLFQSRNPAVILGMANAYYHLAPASGIVGQHLLVAPLLHLAGASHVSARGEEIAALTWDVIVSMVEERKWLFASHQSRFFVHDADSTAVKIAKMKAMAALVSSENASASIREFKHYVRFTDDAVAEEAVRSIGSCIRNQPDVASAGLSTLMKLLRSSRDTLVAQTVIVLKSVILSRTPGSSLPEPQNLVARLAKQLDGITNPKARASVYWLVGQFAGSDVPPKHGLGWDGVATWVPDVFRKGVKGFVQEPNVAKLQILTLATKLLVLSPTTPLLLQLSQYLFTLARYDQDYDIRDRARFLSALQRGVKDEKATAQNEEEEDVGGVVLRREQVKVVLLSQRGHGEDKSVTAGEDYNVGSMSRLIGRKLNGYSDIPEWTDDPTDPSLRESELDNPTRLAAPQTAISSAAQPVFSASTTPRPVHLSSAAALPRGASPASTSPAGSLPLQGRAKFQDLDAFLNSESEESSEESESDDEAPAVLTTRPGAAVPEYDEESSEAESESEADESDEEAESKPLGPQQDLSPLSASAYFEQALEVNPPGNDTTFRVYLNPAVLTKGSKHGAYLVCHHGGGSSGLSFAALAKEVKAKSGGELGVLAYDCRGHGKTRTDGQGSKEADLSLSALLSDMIGVVRHLFPDPKESPSFILMGHSMGAGPILSASPELQKLGYSVSGVVVIDVVEGTAVKALPLMKSIISKRPSSFRSVVDAIHWHITSNSIRNAESACISVPSYLKPDPDVTDPSRESKQVWRTDLIATEPYWKEWYAGLSARFLAAKCARMLVLAGQERLDKELMVGQMQGKFQLEVLPEVGHYLHEDNPSLLALTLVTFWKRNSRILVLPPKIGSTGPKTGVKVKRVGEE